MMTTILIVDDEEDMRELISMYLQNAGYKTFEAENSLETDALLAEEKIDLILLDIMLPGKDGFEMCKEIRGKSSIPIIFLTAKGHEWDKVKGLQLGGDDYIVKPFSPGELVARIEAVLRRSSKNKVTSGVIEAGIVKINPSSRSVMVGEKSIDVTYKEFEMLKIMMTNHAKAFSRESLLDKVWGIDYHGGTRTVDTHIKTLRMKLGKEAGKYIQTVWGYGYKFEVPT